MQYIESNSKQINLIDADSIVNIAANSFRGKEGTKARDVHLKADELLATCIEQTRCEKYELAMSALDEDNFRYAIAKTPHPSGGLGYKNNRSKDRPAFYHSVREHLLENWPVVLIRGREADDAIMEFATQYPNKYIISQDDKDYWVTTETLHNIRTGEIDYYHHKTIDDDGLGYLKLSDVRKLKGRGLKWLYAQMLMGDTIDNIPGVPGIGDVGAYKELNDLQTEAEVFFRVRTIYQDKFGGMESFARLEEIAQLLWIQTYQFPSILDRWSSKGWVHGR